MAVKECRDSKTLLHAAVLTATSTTIIPLTARFVVPNVLCVLIQLKIALNVGEDKDKIHLSARKLHPIFLSPFITFLSFFCLL